MHGHRRWSQHVLRIHAEKFSLERNVNKPQSFAVSTEDSRRFVARIDANLMQCLRAKFFFASNALYIFPGLVKVMNFVCRISVDNEEGAIGGNIHRCEAYAVVILLIVGDRARGDI